MAWAMPSRCRIPPESSNGYWSNRRSGAGIPTRPSIAITRSRASFFDIFRCRNSTSDSWPPIVCTGESAVIGSWKIIAMRLPRIS